MSTIRFDQVTRLIPATFALICIADAAAEGSCYSDTECAPWAICTASHGGCGSAGSPLAVCTGTCVGGEDWRIVPRLGATAVLSDDAEVGASLGLEIVPPVLRGHVSVAAEWWTQELLRMGAAATWPVFPGLVLGARLDVARVSGTWATMAAGRVEYFPWWPMSAFTLAHYVSLAVEAGTIIDETGVDQSTRFVGFGIAVWPPAW